jgi:hypothetical protein
MRTRNVIIIILALTVLGVVAYFLFLRSSSPVGTVPGGQTGTLPAAPGGSGVGQTLPGGQSASGAAALVNVLDSGPVAAYFVNASGTAILVRPDGTIVAIASGQSSSLSSSSISNLIAAVFSRDGRKIAISSGNVQNPQTSIFDTAARSWTQLSMGTLSPAWSPSDMRLAYLRDNGDGTETLGTLDFSKTKPAPVALGTFYVQDMVLDWPAPGTILLSGRPSAYAQNSILAFDIAKKTLAPIVVARGGAYAVWGGSTSTVRGLGFSTTQTQLGGHLQLIDLNGDALQNFSFLTLPSKCVFGLAAMPVASSSVASSSAAATSTSSQSASSSRTLSLSPSQSIYLYCGVPRDQATLSYYPLPDAYAERSIFTSDDIYRIDTGNGRIDAVLSGEAQGFDVTGPHVFGNAFYFINRYDQKLYSVALP